MTTIRLALLASFAATPLLAEETRQMDAHVHGVSTLDLAVENGIIEVNLLSPGMDIVGFEYEASSDAERDAVEAAIRILLMPENVVALPDAAGCRLTEGLARLDAGEHDHEGGQEHDHDAGEGHDLEDHTGADAHAHEEGPEHTEFHVRYIFACDRSEELTMIGFPFFERFENAREINAQYITEAGAGTAEIDRDAAELTLNRP